MDQETVGKCQSILKVLKKRDSLRDFRDTKEELLALVGYSTRVENPVDYAEIGEGLSKRTIKTPAEFVKLMRRVAANCLRFCTDGSNREYRGKARHLLEAIDGQIDERGLTGAHKLHPDYKACLKILDKLLTSTVEDIVTTVSFWARLEVVLSDDYDTYRRVVRQPMDMGRLTTELLEDMSPASAFLYKAEQVFLNCCKYWEDPSRVDRWPVGPPRAQFLRSVLEKEAMKLLPQAWAERHKHAASASAAVAIVPRLKTVGAGGKGQAGPSGPPRLKLAKTSVAGAGTAAAAEASAAPAQTGAPTPLLRVPSRANHDAGGAGGSGEPAAPPKMTLANRSSSLGGGPLRIKLAGSSIGGGDAKPAGDGASAPTVVKLKPQIQIKRSTSTASELPAAPAPAPLPPPPSLVDDSSKQSFAGFLDNEDSMDILLPPPLSPPPAPALPERKHVGKGVRLKFPDRQPPRQPEPSVAPAPPPPPPPVRVKEEGKPATVAAGDDVTKAEVNGTAMDGGHAHMKVEEQGDGGTGNVAEVNGKSVEPVKVVVQPSQEHAVASAPAPVATKTFKIIKPKAEQSTLARTGSFQLKRKGSTLGASSSGVSKTIKVKFNKSSGSYTATPVGESDGAAAGKAAAPAGPPVGTFRPTTSIVLKRARQDDEAAQDGGDDDDLDLKQMQKKIKKANKKRKVKPDAGAAQPSGTSVNGPPLGTFKVKKSSGEGALRPLKIKLTSSAAPPSDGEQAADVKEEMVLGSMTNAQGGRRADRPPKKKKKKVSKERKAAPQPKVKVKQLPRGPGQGEWESRGMSIIDDRLLRRVNEYCVLGKGKRLIDRYVFDRPVMETWPNLAAEYAARIAKPMDLSTVKFNIVHHVYKTPGEMLRDMDLVFANTIQYNGGSHGAYEAELCEVARHLQRYLEAVALEMLPLEDEYRDERLNLSVQRRDEFRRAREEKVFKQLVKPEHPFKFSCNQMKRLIEGLRKEKKVSEFFSEEVPRSTEGYYERIKKPVCLRNILKAIDSGSHRMGELVGDLYLIAENALEFNQPGADAGFTFSQEVCKAARLFKARLDERLPNVVFETWEHVETESNLKPKLRRFREECGLRQGTATFITPAPAEPQLPVEPPIVEDVVKPENEGARGGQSSRLRQSKGRRSLAEDSFLPDLDDPALMQAEMDVSPKKLDVPAVALPAPSPVDAMTEKQRRAEKKKEDDRKKKERESRLKDLILNQVWSTVRLRLEEAQNSGRPLNDVWGAEAEDRSSGEGGWAMDEVARKAEEEEHAVPMDVDAQPVVDTEVAHLELPPVGDGVEELKMDMAPASVEDSREAEENVPETPRPLTTLVGAIEGGAFTQGVPSPVRTKAPEGEMVGKIGTLSFKAVKPTGRRQPRRPLAELLAGEDRLSSQKSSLGLWSQVSSEQLQAQLCRVPAAVDVHDKDPFADMDFDGLENALLHAGTITQPVLVKVFIRRIEAPVWRPDDWEANVPELQLPDKALVHVTVMVGSALPSSDTDLFGAEGDLVVDVNEGELQVRGLLERKAQADEMDVSLSVRDVPLALAFRTDDAREGCPPHLTTLKRDLVLYDKALMGGDTAVPMGSWIYVKKMCEAYSWVRDLDLTVCKRRNFGCSPSPIRESWKGGDLDVVHFVGETPCRLWVGNVEIHHSGLI